MEIAGGRLWLAFGRRVLCADRPRAGVTAAATAAAPAVVRTLDGGDGEVARSIATMDGGASAVVVWDGAKRLAVVRCDGAALVSTHETKVARRATCVTVTTVPGTPPPGEPLVIVGDTLGEATAYPLPDVGRRRKVLVGHTAASITAVTTATHEPAGQRFLISADRNEKIRVSRMPVTALLQAVCLGHTRFVSSLCIATAGVATGSNSLARRAPAAGGAPGGAAHRAAPGPATAAVLAAAAAAAVESAMSPVVTAAGVGASAGTVARATAFSHPHGYAAGELLVSGGGDGTLRLWHWHTGTLLHTVYLQPLSDSAPSAGSSAAMGFVPGSWGSLAAAGPHADGDMLVGWEEEGGGAEGGAGGGGGGADGAGQTAAKGAAAAGAGDSDSGGEAGEASAAATSAATPVIPPILRRPGEALVSGTRGSSGIIVGSIVQLGSGGLFASFVEGEAVVRLHRLELDAESDAIVASVQSNEAVVEKLPQARIAAVGVLHPLAHAAATSTAPSEGGAAAVAPISSLPRILSLAFDGDELVVALLVSTGGDAAAVALRLASYRIAVAAGSGEVAVSEVGGDRASQDAAVATAAGTVSQAIAKAMHATPAVEHIAMYAHTPGGGWATGGSSGGGGGGAAADDADAE